MKNKYILLVLSIFLCTSCQSQNPSNIENFDQLETYIEKAVEKKQIPSVAIAIAKNGETIYEKAFGFSDIENNVAASIHTPYQLASVSKPITATALMSLFEKEGISIDSPIDLYMGALALKKVNNSYKTPTIAQLLNHTAGLDTYFKLQFADEVLPSDNFKEEFKKYGLQFHNPGEKFEYSNLGYGLIGTIINEVSRKSFNSFVKEDIFVPLKMNNSFLNTLEDSLTAVAVKYTNDIKPLPYIYNNTPAAANVFSSVQDLIKFGNFHLQKESTEQAILSNTAKRYMQEYKIDNALYHYYKNTTYGLGWYHRKDDNGYKILWHEGGMTGASSMLKLIPDEGITIAVITNVYNNKFCRIITDALSNIVLPDYKPDTINELGNYTKSPDTSFLGVWEGYVIVDTVKVACKLRLTKKGGAFTYNEGIKEKKIKLNPLFYKNSLVDSYRGSIKSKDVSSKLDYVSVFKLLKNDNTLNGSLTVIDITERQRSAIPFYVKLHKKY